MDHIDLCISCYDRDVIISISHQPATWRDVVRNNRPRYRWEPTSSYDVRDDVRPQVTYGAVYTRGTSPEGWRAWSDRFESHAEALELQRKAYAMLLHTSRALDSQINVICDANHQRALKTRKGLRDHRNCYPPLGER